MIEFHNLERQNNILLIRALITHRAVYVEMKRHKGRRHEAIRVQQQRPDTRTREREKRNSPHDGRADASGVTSASGVGMGLGSGDVRQTGHVGRCRSQGSTQARWNRWPQSGSTRTTSPSP